MFASSPALSAMDHPIYDVWVLDCLERKSTDPVPQPKANNVDNPVRDGEVTGAEAEPPAEAPVVEMPTVTFPGEE